MARRSKAEPKAKPPRAPKRAATPTAETAPAPEERVPLAPDDRNLSSALTLHELFAQQTARMLDRADLSEEQKQSLLIGISCPCCGAGGFSFTAKLKR
jgi:3-oxoacyl-ACP reductase-like protein